MRCPFCAAADTRVMDSRDSAEGTIIRRRRECETCKRRFTTYERVEELNPLVVKKDGRREGFDRDKLLVGLKKACEKRPVSVDQVEQLATEIERKLQEMGEKEVPSTTIGQMVMERLPLLDEVAYVRFASVYRSFRDIAEFMDELKDILQTQAKKAADAKPKGKVVNDEAAMSLALAEAVKGLGRTHPNPAVGAVIVKNGRVIATGYHARAGGPHAEAVALAKAGKRAKGATLYSTLEPCNHFGRTPPCSEAIIEAGVKRVVFASSDPNPLVNGKGVRRIKAAGIAVTAHVLRESADGLNEPFLKAMRTGLPWVTAKAAITLDGKLATSTGKSKWISSEESRQVAHQLRDVVDVVIVGATTVVNDDPQLTTRLPKRATRNPTRLVLDPFLRSSPRATIYDTKAARTIVATLESATSAGAQALTRRGVEVWSMPGARGHLKLEPLLRRLVKDGALHVLVEGGAMVHQSFLESGLVDELVLFIAPRLFGHGGLTWSGGLDVRNPVNAMQFEALDAVRVGPDLMVTARRHR